MLEKYHCNPRLIDDHFSSILFNEFIKEVDSRHLYITRADIQVLSVYMDKLDDELTGKSWEFLDKFTILYKKRLKESDSIISSVLQKPFDFKVKETITLPADSSGYAADEKERAKAWHKWLKLQSLGFLATAGSLDSTANTASILKQEPAMREKTKATERRRLNKILQHPEGFESYVATIFCNSIANGFDPHSNYMAATEKENFEGAVSGQTFSFGMELHENGQGEVAIGYLVPGGPAWKSGELHNDDVLLQIKWENKDPIDLIGAAPEEVEDLLSKSNHDRMNLIVKTINGIQKSVTLIKEPVRDDENFVKSFILNGSKKIGYINLPAFYSQWGNPSGSSCANDVAKEIVKMSKENIEGLILDLRYNGGGSLQEALEMAGIFIEEGTVCFEKGREGKAISLRDPNRGTVYGGPLLLMVNGQSASASEIVAGALQDYNRAIIAGSATYGKATGQVIMPADTSYKHVMGMAYRNKNPEFGFVKVTVEKLYRPTGSSNQCRGVAPDIVFPDLYDKINYRELTNRSALKQDSIKRAVYFTPLSELPLKELNALSTVRVKSNGNFSAVTILAEKMGKRSSEKIILPLNYDEFVAFEKKEQTEWTTFEKKMENTDLTQFKVENNIFDKPGIEADSHSKEVNDNWLTTISKSIYIGECYKILTDYINIANKH